MTTETVSHVQPAFGAPTAHTPAAGPHFHPFAVPPSTLWGAMSNPSWMVGQTAWEAWQRMAFMPWNLVWSAWQMADAHTAQALQRYNDTHKK